MEPGSVVRAAAFFRNSRHVTNAQRALRRLRNTLVLRSRNKSSASRACSRSRCASARACSSGDRGEKEENQEEENQEEENQENADVKKKVVVLSVENAANYLI